MEDTKGVAFGLKDVLLDTEPNLYWMYRSFWKALAEYGINSSQENLQKIHSKNLHRFDRISKELGIQSEELWETRNRNYIEESIKTMKNREISPFSDIDSLQEIVDFFIKEFNYEDLFDFGIGRGSKLKNLKELKPSAYSLERLRDIVKYNKLIYVGDSVKDREFAGSTGIEFIFPSRKRDRGFNSLNKVVDYLLP